MSGWFAVKRGITEHPVFKGDMAKIGFFLWMMENAAYKPTDIDVSGIPYTVPRGALCFSQRFLASKSGMTVKSLRTFLAALERHGIVAVKVVQIGKAKETARTQVTLCNYEKYQGVGNNRGTTWKQHGNEEEQGNNTPVGKAANAASSEVAKLDTVASAAWAVGKAFLAKHGIKNPGAVIGSLMKDAGSHADLVQAIEAAEKAETQDPIPYIRSVLKASGKPYRRQQPREREGYTNAGAFGMIREVN